MSEVSSVRSGMSSAAATPLGLAVDLSGRAEEGFAAACFWLGAMSRVSFERLGSPLRAFIPRLPGAACFSSGASNSLQLQHSFHAQIG